MTDRAFVELCINTVCDYFNKETDKTNTFILEPKDVYVVWQCKALQNFKALLSTTVSDGMYYEITYNGNKNELYFDAYKKWKNIKIEL